MTYDPMSMLKEFHDTFSSKQRYDSLQDKLERRWNLMDEEYNEVSDALAYLEKTDLGMTSNTVSEAKAELAKELADLLYVVYGTAEELNIPLEQVFKVVHDSNMSKVWDDGTVHYRTDGKVLKPPTYIAPDIKAVLDAINT